MAEFKRLSDVEVVAEPTESANVLIEENGVIKKAPKTAVGGAGGASKFDLIFYYNNEVGQISISNGSYEDFVNKCTNGIAPSVVLISSNGQTLADGLINCSFSYANQWNINDESVSFYFGKYNDEYINMYSDGSAEYSYIG
jgi:hypothetical protein